MEVLKAFASDFSALEHAFVDQYKGVLFPGGVDLHVNAFQCIYPQSLKKAEV